MESNASHTDELYKIINKYDDLIREYQELEVKYLDLSERHDNLIEIVTSLKLQQKVSEVAANNKWVI